MITSIVFSKDRALQLDLTLKSIKKNMPFIDTIRVIFVASTEEYKSAYNILQSEHNDVFFFEQNTNLYSIITYLLTSKYVIFFTDDNIVYRKSVTSRDDIDGIMSMKEMCCVSFRMGININQRRYDDGIVRKTEFPSFINLSTGKHIAWSRLEPRVGEYWSYALSVDGHLFHSETINNILSMINGWPESKLLPNTPNVLEAYWQRFFFEVPLLMSSEHYGCVVNSPNNRVQDDFKNKCGDTYNYLPESLNTLFLRGERLKVENFESCKIYCPHTELDLLNGL